MAASKPTTKVPAAAKKPQDHQAPTVTEDYVFKAAAGGTVVLPPFAKAFTVGRLRRGRHKGEMEMTFELLEELCDEAELEIIDALDLDEFQRLQVEWQEHSQVTMGESPAS